MASYEAFLDAAGHARSRITHAAGHARAKAVGRPRTNGVHATTMPVHRNISSALDAQLDKAERIVARLSSEMGEEKTNRLLQDMGKRAVGSQPRRTQPPGYQDMPETISSDDEVEPPKIPYGFWRRFITDELKLMVTDRLRMHLFRALEAYAIRHYEGGQTRMALRGHRRGLSRRSNGGAENATKAVGLGFTKKGVHEISKSQKNVRASAAFGKRASCSRSLPRPGQG